MKFVDGKQVSHDVVPILSIILYVPSISRFFLLPSMAKTPCLDAFALCGGDLSRSSVPAKSFLPIPSNCLHIKRTSRHLSKSGLFERFFKVYKIVVNPILGDICTKNVIHAHHMPDSERLIVPDMYANLPCYLYPDPAQDYAAARQFYLKMLEDAPSNCSGCHQYIKHSYYRFPKICFTLALIIDSSTIEDHQQIVTINKLLFMQWFTSQTSIMWMSNAPFEFKGYLIVRNGKEFENLV